MLILKPSSPWGCGRPGYLLQPNPIQMPSTCSTGLLYWSYAEQLACSLSLRPASRDQIRYRAVRQRQSDVPSEIFSLTLARTFRSALRGGAKRLATDAVLIKGAADQSSGQQLNIQSDKLPTYLQSLTNFRPARPSKGSPGKGSDVSGFPKTPGSLQINLLFTMYAEQASGHLADANFFPSKTRQSTSQSSTPKPWWS